MAAVGVVVAVVAVACANAVAFGSVGAEVAWGESGRRPPTSPSETADSQSSMGSRGWASGSCRSLAAAALRCAAGSGTQIVAQIAAAVAEIQTAAVAAERQPMQRPS